MSDRAHLWVCKSKPGAPTKVTGALNGNYSLHHQPIGKSTQARPHTAAAHVRYITRPSAVSRVDAARMPKAPGKAASFMVQGEEGDRKNARVADKLMLALPRELDAVQRAQLVRDFAEDVTQGRAPWLAAFHDKGKDAQNPHAHLLIRDRDPATGKRVAGLSDNGSTERLRGLWEDHANGALERAGRPERIDRRTLEAQGLSREPTIHEGPKARQMDARGAAPESRMRRRRNRPGSHQRERNVDYGRIDGGRSRPAYNRQLNRPETPVDYWAAIDAHKRNAELDQLRSIHHPPPSVDIFGQGKAGRQQPLQRGEFPIGRARPEPGRGLGRGDDGSHGLFARQADGQTPQLGQDEIKHSLIYPNSPSGSNRNIMAGKDDDKSIDDDIRGNQGKMRRLNGSFNNLLGQAYHDPASATDKMAAMGTDQGDNAVRDALQFEPDKFGPMPEGAANRDAALNARKQLPAVYNDYRKLRDENDGLFRAKNDDGKPGGQDGPGSGGNIARAPNAQGTQPTSLKGSSYPMESPMRPQQEQAPAAPNGQAAPQQWPPASFHENDPFSTLPKPGQAAGTPPASQEFQPHSFNNELAKDKPAKEAAPAFQPRSFNDELAKPQPEKPVEGVKAPSMQPQELARKPLETPATPERKGKGGLADGR